MSTPTPASTKPLTHYTGSTPNGHQTSVFFAELKAVYPKLDYDVFPIDISTNVQQEPWFIKINPNGRIPALVDHSRHDFAVFETSAILLYLAHHYDKKHAFWFDPVADSDNYSEMLQWIFFAHGGVAPMSGQSEHFNKYAKVDIPYGKKRYLNETKRLYNVLEIRLKDREWLAGTGRGKYSLADIKTFPWVRIHTIAGVDNLDAWPSVKAWLQRCKERPAAKLGLEAV